MTRFLIRLAEDPELLAEFRVAPERLAKEARLTPAELRLLVRGDSDQVRGALARKAAVRG